MNAAVAIMPEVGITAACAAVGASRATLSRRRKPKLAKARKRQTRALSEEERQNVLAVMNSERFMDAAPRQVYASLLDEGCHLASVSTIYRVLSASQGIRERRAIRRHATYTKPELVARGPNQVWSWDITKVRGPQRRDWFHLYVMLDIFSRKVVGWMLASTESARLAEEWIRGIVQSEGIAADTLTIHADRGTSMRSKTVAELFDDLDIARSHSRPRTSNDNPFSEAGFKTFKYHWSYPGSFDGLGEGRAYFDLLFRWYNDEHRHSGIADLTPSSVHGGKADEVLAARQRVLDERYAKHPERFVNGPPRVRRPSVEVWINRPTQQHVALSNGEDDSSSSPQKAENLAAESRPSPAGPPAQASEASAEGVAGMAETTGQVRAAPAEAR